MADQAPQALAHIEPYEWPDDSSRIRVIEMRTGVTTTNRFIAMTSLSESTQMELRHHYDTQRWEDYQVYVQVMASLRERFGVTWIKWDTTRPCPEVEQLTDNAERLSSTSIWTHLHYGNCRRCYAIGEQGNRCGHCISHLQEGNPSDTFIYYAVHDENGFVINPLFLMRLADANAYFSNRHPDIENPTYRRYVSVDNPPANETLTHFEWCHITCRNPQDQRGINPFMDLL